MERISKHISNFESVKSQTAKQLNIDNKPNKKQIQAMKLIAEKVFEPLRNHFRIPIGINSFFRCPELNIAVGGSKSSDHCKGEAIDIDADLYGGITNAQIFHWIRENLEFDQLIWEYGNDDEPAWVHVSFGAKGNKNQVLVKEHGKKYRNWKAAA